jgi:hypothetical protein
MGAVVGRATRPNFGYIRDYSEKKRVLLEQLEPFLLCSATACHPVPSLEAALPPPSRPAPRPTAPAPGRWPDVLDVHLTAQLLTVSADTVYDLLAAGEPAGTHGGPEMAHHDNGGAAMAGAVRHVTPDGRTGDRPGARLPTGIRPRWWTPCTRGKRGSARRSSTSRGQAVSSAVTRLESLSLRSLASSLPPPVSLDVVSLVASSCGYERGHIEPCAAHEFVVHVATQRGLAACPQHCHPPRAQSVAPVR